MKIKVLLTMLFFVFILVFSYSDFTLNGGMMFDRNERKPVLGVNLDWPKIDISDNISLSLGYVFSLNKNGFYTSAPGLIGVGLIGLEVANSDDDDDSDEDEDNGEPKIAGSIGVILVLVPENIKFHYWLRPDFAFALGLHPWGIEYDADAEKLYYTNGISLDFNYIIMSRLLISPYTSFRYVYKTETPVWELGLRLGVVF
ncbi:MAG TPA: hypothetical protein PK624_05500 [Spirochaetota bacterium]|nr:hypothetical protein [Spirochaetota bacterium]HOR44233.1 hypothetical protein [Spirochaetota bacterium]HPK55655.1 hypothetical protein [Spirochaetota bacterium]